MAEQVISMFPASFSKGDDTRSGRRPPNRYHDPHLQRPPHLRRGFGTSRIRADQALSIGLKENGGSPPSRLSAALFALCLRFVFLDSLVFLGLLVERAEDFAPFVIMTLR